MSARPRIVVLDDYEDSLRKTADWKPVEALADLKVHTERLRGDALLEAIKDADTKKLVNAQRLALMRPDSILVNTVLGSKASHCPGH